MMGHVLIFLVVYRYQAGWEAFAETLKAQMEKQARTNAAKAMSHSGESCQKRRRLDYCEDVPDISVDVDISDDAPSLVSQLERAVLSTINPVSEQMGLFMMDLGFSSDDISPFCHQEFTSSGSRFVPVCSWHLLCQLSYCHVCTVMVVS